MPKLCTCGVTKYYNNTEIIEDINIYVDECEIVSLLGSSGVGKTTLFNVITGVNYPEKGYVLLNDVDITGQSGHIGYMQQKDLLLHYKKVIDNVTLPLIIRGEKKRNSYELALQFFKRFGLDGYEYMYPDQLSGGMRQRAALLRTYFFNKDIFLLDEPFSALDAITKQEMHSWFLNLKSEIRLSAFFITHDIDEAVFLSDRVYIMSKEKNIKSAGKITAEIPINYLQHRNASFRNTNSFIEYKKKILAYL